MVLLLRGGVVGGVQHAAAAPVDDFLVLADGERGVRALRDGPRLAAELPELLLAQGAGVELGHVRAGGGAVAVGGVVHDLVDL